jgi:(p)ppGpp synthase/HD superfamily hydrolase
MYKFKKEHAEIEKAIIFASSKFSTCKDLIKPTLFHSIRVGCELYANDYSSEIVIAGILHDTLEDTDTTEQEIREQFGDVVTDLILANSKDMSITDKKIRDEELLERCLNTSEEASIVKAADILDNYRYYSSIEDQKGVNRCKEFVAYLKKHFKYSYKEKIFPSYLKK